MAKLNSIIRTTSRRAADRSARSKPGAVHASSFCGKLILDTVLEDGSGLQLEINPQDPAFWRAVSEAMNSDQLDACPACGSDVDILDHCTSLKTARCK